MQLKALSEQGHHLQGLEDCLWTDWSSASFVWIHGPRSVHPLALPLLLQ